jgi:hypothetical protein
LFRKFLSSPPVATRPAGFSVPAISSNILKSSADARHRRGSRGLVLTALPSNAARPGGRVLSGEAWQHARIGIEDPQRAGWLGQMALSCAWSGFAAAALVVGFRFRAPALRVFALLLFGVTTAKVMIVDLGRVEQIYRVASFLVLGVLLFGASWLYHRPGARR